MAVVSITIKDFACYMLEKISELECKANITLPLYAKILISETGTIEQLLSILTNSKTQVKILKQKESPELIKRQICIINEKTGQRLAYARSNIFPTYLPQKIIKKIKERNEGIGKIIVGSKLETFRHLLKIGYDPKTKSAFRIYQIIHKRRVAFEIKENFII
ncbi:MAG: chorismate pyruvate-lyase family protein [Thermoproteota archaeon]|nr:chorismate pyruvate-lyase family protein [Thermoproteota archaeon]